MDLGLGVLEEQGEGIKVRDEQDNDEDEESDEEEVGTQERLQARREDNMDETDGQQPEKDLLGKLMGQTRTKRKAGIEEMTNSV